MRPQPETPIQPTRRNPEHDRRDRREKTNRQRLIALPLRRAYPRVSMLKLRLVFGDGSDRPLSEQSHSLHPPAAAFFRFPCPLSDCDGEFDIGPAIEAMANSSMRNDVRHFECQGVRVRDRATGHRCGLQLECSIQMESISGVPAATTS